MPAAAEVPEEGLEGGEYPDGNNYSYIQREI